MSVNFFTLNIIENLGGNEVDPIFRAGIGFFPDIDEDYGGLFFIIFFQFLHDGRHHFTGDAFFGHRYQPW